MASSLRDSSPAALGKEGRVLAIDYGRRRIGLAISDEMGLTAQPLSTLTRTNRREDLRRLREIVRQHNVRRIVVGHPLRLDGSAGEMAEEAAQFAARIEKALGVPVEMVDERLTSWAAKQMLLDGKLSGVKRGGSIDQIAATLILQDYLKLHAERKRARR